MSGLHFQNLFLENAFKILIFTHCTYIQTHIIICLFLSLLKIRWHVSSTTNLNLLFLTNVQVQFQLMWKDLCMNTVER